jgi:hypothetical protein
VGLADSASVDLLERARGKGNANDPAKESYKRAAFKAKQVLLPVIQLVIRVGDSDARLLEIAHGANHICGGHVVPRIIVKENNKHAFVVTMGGKDDKVVQGFEVNGVPC